MDCDFLFKCAGRLRYGITGFSFPASRSSVKTVRLVCNEVGIGGFGERNGPLRRPRPGRMTERPYRRVFLRSTAYPACDMLRTAFSCTSGKSKKPCKYFIYKAFCFDVLRCVGDLTLPLHTLLWLSRPFLRSAFWYTELATTSLRRISQSFWAFFWDRRMKISFNVQKFKE